MDAADKDLLGNSFNKVRMDGVSQVGNELVGLFEALLHRHHPNLKVGSLDVALGQDAASKHHKLVYLSEANDSFVKPQISKAISTHELGRSVGTNRKRSHSVTPPSTSAHQPIVRSNSFACFHRLQKMGLSLRFDIKGTTVRKMRTTPSSSDPTENTHTVHFYS